MRFLRPVALALTAVALVACSRARDPLPMTGEREALVGTWVSKQAVPAEGKTVNVVLILGSDGAASYMSCMDYEQRGDGGSVSRGHSYTGARGGQVTALSDRQLTLSMQVEGWSWAINYQLEIDGLPRQEAGAWLLKVDGVTLRKLGAGEHSDHEQWPCWTDDGDDKRDQRRAGTVLRT
jgi:hypothetical protein